MRKGGAGAGGGGGIGEDSAGVAAARVAERIWEVVDEGNRVVLIGRLFELSDHPDCFRGVTDAKLVRTTDCTALALCLPVGLMCRCVPCVWCGNCSPRILPRLSSLTHLTGARNGG